MVLGAPLMVPDRWLGRMLEPTDVVDPQPRAEGRRGIFMLLKICALAVERLRV
jgi:hypothetical protein